MNSGLVRVGACEAGGVDPSWLCPYLGEGYLLEVPFENSSRWIQPIISKVVADEVRRNRPRV
jgi:hypothetical protein